MYYSNDYMENARKIAAAVVGILVLVVVFFLAKLAGDQIRQRFLKPKTPVSVTVNTKPVVNESNNLLNEKPEQTATYSAIPSTGPNDWIYVVLGFLFVSGLSVLRFAKR